MPAGTSINMLVWCARPSTPPCILAVLVTPDTCACIANGAPTPTLFFTQVPLATTLKVLFL